MIESFTTPTAQPAPVEFTDDIDWGEEELEAPACDLSNPEVCESCQ